jgi:hypothetical protein
MTQEELGNFFVEFLIKQTEFSLTSNNFPTIEVYFCDK